METGAQGPLDFRVSSEFEGILRELEKSGLGWIAEEIETTIRKGKLISKEAFWEQKRHEGLRFGEIQPEPRPRKSASITVPFEADEQLTIIVKTLRNYFVTLHDTWNESQRTFSDLFEGLEIRITQPETDEELIPFEPGFDRQSRELDDLLRELWSQGKRYDSDD